MLNKFVKILMKVQYVVYGAIMVVIIRRMVKKIKKDMKRA